MFNIVDFANDMFRHVVKATSSEVAGRELTLCWRCSAPCPRRERACPACGASNANHDLDQAAREAGSP